MPAAYFIVRATVTDPAKRAAFDAWYSREHVPDAVKSFGATKRGATGALPNLRCITRCINSPIRQHWIARCRVRTSTG
jgi:hypothetical protein